MDFQLKAAIAGCLFGVVVGFLIRVWLNIHHERKATERRYEEHRWEIRDNRIDTLFARVRQLESDFIPLKLTVTKEI